MEEIVKSKMTEAMKRAQAKYNKEKTTSFTFKLVNNTDSELIEALKKESNKQGLIKQLLREHYGIK